MKKIITFGDILAKRAKAVKYFVESGCFVYLGSQPDRGTESINHLYMNSDGLVGFSSTDRKAIPQSFIQKKDAYEMLSFTTRVWLWGKQGEDYIEENGSWKIISHDEHRRIVIRQVAENYSKRGYSHKCVTWALWNNPSSDWVCPVAIPVEPNDRRKNEIGKMIQKKKIQEMCLSLMEVFKVSRAASKNNFGEVEYNLIEMKKVVVTDSGNGRDYEDFDMDENDVKDAEKILAEEEKEEEEDKYAFEEMNN